MKHLYESVFSGAMLALLVATPMPSLAQTPQAPSAAEAQAALNNQAPAPAPFSNAQLDQMLAPIALYPDQLLTQVLMASTFPDQLVDAQKWLQDQQNAALKGDELASALQSLPWDPSVKSLVAFPQIIAMMTAHLDWTQALGAAFADQEVQVFSRVQFLRQRAKSAGMLKSSSQIAVTEQDSDIIIAPANPDEVYVPVYNPADVYGEWPDQDAPPVYIPPPPNFYSGPVGAGIGFSVGFGVVAPLWGWGHPDWRRHSVTIDPGRYEHITNRTYIRENHITIQGNAWHRSGPVAFVPEAQRPRPSYQGGEAPHGTVQPSAVFRPGAGPGPHPAGQAQPGPRPANETQPGQRPGENARPNEAPGPHPAGQAQPGQRPGENARPNEAPGPHPAGQAQPGPRPGENARPNEAPGPHPAGQARPGQHPEEHAAPQGGPPHQEEHAAPQGGPPHQEEHAAPQGGSPHQEEHAAPQGGPPHQEEHAAPQGGPPHQEEHAPPQGGPPHQEEHAPPQAPHPEEHAAPPQPQHPAGPPPQAPHPEEHAAPPQPQRPAGPPPQAPHPAGPPPQAQHPGPQQQAHPGPQQQAHPAQQGHPGPAKPGEEKKDEQQQH